MRSKNEDTLNEILNFINDWYFQNNDYPTLMQIADNLNIGTTTAHRYVAELINRGEISKIIVTATCKRKRFQNRFKGRSVCLS